MTTKLTPNKGGGADITQKYPYSWTQNNTEIEIDLTLPIGTRTNNILIEFKRDYLKVLINNEPAINGRLVGIVVPDDCFWTVVDKKYLLITLSKFEKIKLWNGLIDDGNQIDLSKVITEPTKLHELEFDPVAKQLAEKMIYQQRGGKIPN